jgi:hypothetical protein
LGSPVIASKVFNFFNEFWIFQYIKAQFFLISVKDFSLSIWFCRYVKNIDSSNEPHYAKLRVAIAKNPLKFVKTINEALNFVENGKYVYPIQEDSFAMLEAKQRCNLITISKGCKSV